MKKAIVFGATGKLGCYSALALKEEGYDVVAVERRIFDGGYFATKDIKFVGGVMLEDVASLEKIPDQYYDVVVNMAGTMPAHANNDPMPYVQSIYEVFSNGKAKKEYRPDMPDTPQILLSGKKSKEVLGWEPIWTWQDACLDMKKECIENPVELMWGKTDLLDKIV